MYYKGLFIDFIITNFINKYLRDYYSYLIEYTLIIYFD